jgi:hypothetical protein
VAFGRTTAPGRVARPPTSPDPVLRRFRWDFLRACQGTWLDGREHLPSTLRASGKRNCSVRPWWRSLHPLVLLRLPWPHLPSWTMICFCKGVVDPSDFPRAGTRLSRSAHVMAIARERQTEGTGCCYEEKFQAFHVRMTSAYFTVRRSSCMYAVGS